MTQLPFGQVAGGVVQVPCQGVDIGACRGDLRVGAQTGEFGVALGDLSVDGREVLARLLALAARRLSEPGRYAYLFATLSSTILRMTVR